MESRRIFSILKSFSEKEFNELGKFIRSPYHNSNKNLIKYFDFLKPYYPKFKQIKTTPERIYKKIFPGKKFNSAITRNLDSEFVITAKEFLALNNYKSKSFQVRINLLEELRKKKLNILFTKEFSTLFEKLESGKIRDEDYYLNRFILESELSKYYDETLTLSKALSYYDSQRDELNDLTNYFLILILKAYLTTFSGTKKLNFEKSMILHEEIMNYVSSNLEYYKQIDIIYLLYNFLLLYKEPENEDIYNILKSTIIGQKHSIKDYDFKTYFIEIYNHCKRRQLINPEKYGPESLELLKIMLNMGVFIEDDKRMSDHNFINIAHTAFRVNEFDWAEKFINEYKENLSPDRREIAYNYVKALSFLIKGNKSQYETKKNFYEKSIEYLSKVKSEDFYYTTRIKNMTLQLYYELDEIDLALGLIDTYNHYLSRNKQIPKHLRTGYSRYINSLNKLIKIKTGSKIIHTRQLHRDISRIENMPYKGWLLRKIKELEDKDLEKHKKTDTADNLN
jgi:hypothetical protein